MAKTQDFLDAIITEIRTSDSLAAVLGSELASEHVILRRFRRGGEVSGHAPMVQKAPMIYICPGASTWSPMTENNARVDSTVNATVVQSGYVSGTLPLTFTDNLVAECMKDADGAGGTASFISNIGTNFRVKVATPIEDGNINRSEVRLNIVFQATLYPGV